MEKMSGSAKKSSPHFDRTNSASVDFELSNLIDAPSTQSLMDDFYELAGIPMSIIDLQGKVLVGVGWQPICLNFHRAHPETSKHCQESDTQLSTNIPSGEFKLYKCKNNMWDISTPMMLGGRHVGNIISGQFFFEGESLDYELFRSQARRYGFDEVEYLAALEAVPRLSRTSVERGMSFSAKFAQMLSQMSYSNISLVRSLAQRDSLISERQTAQNRLVYLASFPEQNPNPIMEVSLDGCLQYANPALRRLYPDLETRGLAHPWLSDWETIVRSFKTSPPEAIIRDITVDEHTYQQTLHYFAEEGFVRIYSFDISGRKTAEKSLQKSESFYRQTLESIPGMVFTTTPDGYCDYQSQQWVDYTGIPMSDHLGDGWNQLLHLEDRARAYEAWREAVEKKAPYDLEYRVRRRDGVYEWFKVIGRPISDEMGAIVRWFGVAANINELILTEEALYKAKSVAEEATRAKSEFLANMSHEIRTPMTVFMAAIEHLLQIDRSPERRHLLGMAEQSGQCLRSLIDDILDISRIEARKVEIEEKPFDLRACVRAVVDLFVLPAREKNLRLKMEVTPDSPEMIAGDPDKIGQVLINLIGNAVKFTHQGEVRVCVHPRGDFLEFAVADTGIGIPEEKHDMLFQSFSQVDSSFTRKFGGSGLGLAISKGLVELMGGEISIQRREAEGSVFTFTIPLRRVERPGGPLAAAPSEDLGKENSTARILLAEDDPMIREMITLVLSQRGLHPDTAASGRQAVEKWQDGDFDLIFMDLQMPEMNGLEATQAIRAREAAGHKRTCIIGLTAHTSREIREECLAAGMDQVLTKPLKIKDLLSAVDACL
ncbi:MAG: PocR ligand-binding domain-containing protein [Desulfuromonadales bacterium]|nr:PocR ligand-binding domain-containing protein [Desulfuromonadales bacterium]